MLSGPVLAGGTSILACSPILVRLISITSVKGFAPGSFLGTSGQKTLLAKEALIRHPARALGRAPPPSRLLPTNAVREPDALNKKVLVVSFRMADHPGVSPASVTSRGSVITTSSGAPAIKKQFRLRHSLPFDCRSFMWG